MGEMTINFPPALRRWIEQRIAEGDYADVAEYLNDLIRRDQLGLVADEEPDSPEYIVWVREKIAEGEASGISDESPLEFIEKLIANRRSLHG